MNIEKEDSNDERSDSDLMSVQSDFSIIPESMVNLELNGNPPEALAASASGANIAMISSFFSSHSSIGSSQSCFKKVLFMNIQRAGVDEGAPLGVIYTIVEDLQPSSSDRIALYKIGFSSTKDFLCYKWAPSVQEPGTPITVLFDESALPNDRDDFYQICYLKQDGKIYGVSSPFQLKQTASVSSSLVDSAEGAARRVLSLRTEKLVDENGSLEQSLAEARKSLASVENKLTEEEEQYLKNEDEYKQEIQSLKEAVALKEDYIKKYKLEVREKEEEAKEQHNIAIEMQQKLSHTLQNMNSLEESLCETRSVKGVVEERHEVLQQDNKDLQETLIALKEELSRSLCEKQASEKVALELSVQLQSAQERVQKLLKVVARLDHRMQRLAQMEASSISLSEEWLCVDGVAQDENDDENHVEGLVRSMEETTNIEGAARAETSPVGVQDQMKLFVSRLDQQLEQMQSIKSEMECLVISHEASNALLPVNTDVTLPVVDADQQQDQEVNADSDSVASDQTAEMSDHPSVSARVAPTSSELNVQPASTTQPAKPVLYGQSFLPASCTAPVFLPERLHNLQRESLGLPSPLIPERTSTARVAAVFNEMSAQGERREPEEQPRHEEWPEAQASASAPVDETVEENATGTETRTEDSQNSQLQCPMCPLVFLPTAIRLMDEHISSHLDHICPVCSLAFPRSETQESFEAHVHSHFDDESTSPSPSQGEPYFPHTSAFFRSPRRSGHRRSGFVDFD